MTDQSPASPSLRAAAGGTSAELTLDAARKLYGKFADKDGGDAIRVMAQIALWGKRQQVEGGRLRLLALRQLGRFLIRNGRGQGRLAKPLRRRRSPKRRKRRPPTFYQRLRVWASPTAI